VLWTFRELLLLFVIFEGLMAEVLMFRAIVLWLSFAYVTSNALAEVLVAPPLARKLGPESTAKISAIRQLERIKQINGTVTINDNIFVADRIVFWPNSKLVFSSNSSESIIIAANIIAFKDPLQLSFVERSSPPTGKNGDKGTPGNNGVNWSDSGGEGQIGGDGNPGLQQPKFLVFAGAFQSPNGSPMIKGLSLTLELPASAGGIGGDGGNGGQGVGGIPALGDHKRGLRCRGGRDGGPGGNGGRGGRGGNGGDGSKGLTVVMIGPTAAADLFQYANIHNSGGDGGAPGAGGQAGSPGAGGAADGSNFPCDTRPAGLPGSYPNPLHNGLGQKGNTGPAGDVFVEVLPNQSSPFIR
jgi:hypothetical protein